MRLTGPSAGVEGEQEQRLEGAPGRTGLASGPSSWCGCNCWHSEGEARPVDGRSVTAQSSCVDVSRGLLLFRRKLRFGSPVHPSARGGIGPPLRTRDHISPCHEPAPDQRGAHPPSRRRQWSFGAGQRMIIATRTERSLCFAFREGSDAQTQTRRVGNAPD